MPLTAPPRDENDRSVTPHDHPEINAHDGIIRRVSDEQIVPDPKSGGRRVSSKAFNPSSGPNGGMSVDIEKLILERGENPRTYVTTPRFTGSLYFNARHFREEGLSVGYDPLPENECHGEVWGSFTKPLKGRLQRKAVWFVEIEGVRLI